MKKLIITTAIILGLAATALAEDNTGGLFGRAGNNNNGNHSGYVLFGAKDGENSTDVPMPMLPAHGQEGNQPAPLGSGIAMMLCLGAAYMMAKRSKEK